MKADGTQEPLAESIDFDQLELPMLPDVAAQVMDLCQQEDTDAAKLSEVLHRDQSLASHVLRVANSPVYAPKVPIASLQQAVGRLGLRQVADLALSISLRGMVFRQSEHAELLQAAWQHAVAAGFFAKEIARVRRRNVDCAFLCGLLHDVGKALLIANLEKICTCSTRGITDDLPKFLDDYHGPAGRALAGAWGLPPAICAAIAQHHDWQAADEHKDVIAMTWLADQLAALFVPGEPQPLEEELRASEIMDVLDLYADDFDGLLARAPEVLALVEQVS